MYYDSIQKKQLKKNEKEIIDGLIEKFELKIKELSLEEEQCDFQKIKNYIINLETENTNLERKNLSLQTKNFNMNEKLEKMYRRIR